MHGGVTEDCAILCVYHELLIRSGFGRNTIKVGWGVEKRYFHISKRTTIDPDHGFIDSTDVPVSIYGYLLSLP